MIIIGSTMGALLVSFGSGIRKSIETVFNDEANREALMLGIAVFERAKSYVVASGVGGTLLTVAVVLEQSGGDPNEIIYGFGVALLPQIWGLFLAYGVLMPVVSSLQRRLEEMER
jgi:flagellar motor component MotA